MKSLSKRFVCVIVPLLILFSCMSTGCIFTSRNSEPVYRYKEYFDEFFANLEADQDVYDYSLFMDDHTMLFGDIYGDVIIGISVNSEAWDHIDEIIMDQILPQINNAEFLLALDEYVYNFENRHVRLGSLDVTFYTSLGPDSEGLSQDVRITYGSASITGFKKWYKLSDVEWPDKSDGILLSRDPYENDQIYKNTKPGNEKDLNVYFVTHNQSVDWLCTYLSTNTGIDGDDYFITNIQLNDSQISYKEVERLFLELFARDNGKIREKIKKAEQICPLLNAKIRMMRVVFMVDGSTEYVVFEATSEDKYKEWTITQCLADPDMVGTVVSRT